MIPWDQVLLILFGVAAGTIVGTEYGSWRVMRKVKKYFNMGLELLGVDLFLWKDLPPKEKRQYLGAKIADVFKEMFPEVPPAAQPPPSRAVSISGNEWFFPKCPQCGRLSAPLRNIPGTGVKAFCEEHGEFIQQIPEEEDKT